MIKKVDKAINFLLEDCHDKYAVSNVRDCFKSQQRSTKVWRKMIKLKQPVEHLTKIKTKFRCILQYIKFNTRRPTCNHKRSYYVHLKRCFFRFFFSSRSLKYWQSSFGLPLHNYDKLSLRRIPPIWYILTMSFYCRKMAGNATGDLNLSSTVKPL